MTGIGARARVHARRLRRVAASVRGYRARGFRDARYVSESNPIVIGGCGRSGTTLLRVILDSHPNICCGPEARIFNHALTRRRSDALAARFTLDPDAVWQLRRSCASQAEFIDRFFGDYSRASGKPRWAEKTPGNVAVVGYVLEHFPQARFVHVIRDGRDVACSLRTHPRHRLVDGQLVPRNTWHPIEECAARWVSAIRAGRPFRGHPGYTEVRYEDLVTASEPTLRALLEWLGEPWDDAVLQHSVVDSPSREVARFPQNPEATMPVYRSAIGRWRTDLSPADAAVVRKIAGDLLVELGYAADAGWQPEPA